MYVICAEGNRGRMCQKQIGGKEMERMALLECVPYKMQLNVLYYL